MKIFRITFFLSAVFSSYLAAQTVTTTRSSTVKLPLPKSEESFHFLIYGDRTGGVPAGLPVLAQAVADTNMLSPDLVMTVGDLVNGYCGQAEWDKMAAEYSGIMNGLKMPWFPVAGNHDVYWRGQGKPEGEHEASFERHFGPLWYWFKHKDCAFIALFSDEAPPGVAKDFTNPIAQGMSTQQMEWLAATLAETKNLKHTFVFLHHPRWIVKGYPGAQWDGVHTLLKASGNVRAVFAGHIHRMRYDGTRDGIEYITLGATGASIPGIYPAAGYLHHMNLVTVRPEGATSCALPVGAVIDPKKFTPELIADIDRTRVMPLDVERAPIAVDANGQGAGLVEYSITNPVQTDIEVTVLPSDFPGEWVSTADLHSMVIKPGEKRSGAFSLIRVKAGFDDSFHAPSVEFRVELLRPDARIPLPPRTVDIPVVLRALPADYFQPTAEERTLSLDGKSAIRIETGKRTLPDGPFTAEGWIKAAAGVSGDIISKAEQSEYALGLSGGQAGFHCHLGGRWISVIADTPIPADTWVHVAGTYDGTNVKVYVDGAEAKSVAASGARTPNSLPVFLGANPDARANPVQRLVGSLDEVRLSSAVRYTGAFTPARRFTRDADTLYLFHCDKLIGPFLPSDSEGGFYGVASGTPKIAAP